MTCEKQHCGLRPGLTQTSLWPGWTRMHCVTYSRADLTDMSLDGILTFQRQKIKTRIKNEDLSHNERKPTLWFTIRFDTN